MTLLFVKLWSAVVFHMHLVDAAWPCLCLLIWIDICRIYVIRSWRKSWNTRHIPSAFLYPGLRCISSRRQMGVQATCIDVQYGFLNLSTLLAGLLVLLDRLDKADTRWFQSRYELKGPSAFEHSGYLHLQQRVRLYQEPRSLHPFVLQRIALEKSTDA